MSVFEAFLSAHVRALCLCACECVCVCEREIVEQEKWWRNIDHAMVAKREAGDQDNTYEKGRHALEERIN